MNKQRERDYFKKNWKQNCPWLRIERKDEWERSYVL